MPDVGVYLVGAYFEFCRGCEVVSYDHSLVNEQGDIDVLGLDLENKRAFVAEAKIHLSGMGGYGGQPGPKIREQIVRAQAFLNQALPSWDASYSVWSPHVTPAIRSQVAAALGPTGLPDVDLVFNEEFAARLSELSEIASRDTKYRTNPGYRLLQVLARSGRHGFRIN